MSTAGIFLLLLRLSHFTKMPVCANATDGGAPRCHTDPRWPDAVPQARCPGPPVSGNRRTPAVVELHHRPLLYKKESYKCPSYGGNYAPDVEIQQFPHVTSKNDLQAHSRSLFIPS